MSAIKVVLSVRQTTPNDIVLAEIGMPSLENLIMRKQENIFQKILAERQDLQDDPFMHVFNLVANSALGRHIKNVACGRYPDVDPIMNIRRSTRSKFNLYRDINPRLEPPPVHTTSASNIPEHLRISFTRIRTSSHRLRIETGRWARLEREDRLCACGQDVQDEEHVLQFCPLVNHLRPPNMIFPYCLQENVPYQAIYDILQFFEY